MDVQIHHAGENQDIAVIMQGQACVFLRQDIKNAF